ncbi:zinc-dependent metalloprotease [Vibrio harveyi]|uniref:zinc-dependent metalloprotease n=1 Tax=Vibrio harveyi TaxID=669 RepID=UPI000680C32A|nr:zinc-dependent metalloprotease [Vibrio harveyi]
MKKTLYCTGAMVVAAGLVGCGPKDEPYKVVERSPYELSTSDIDNLSSETFLYRRMMGETPRYLTTVGGKIGMGGVDDIKLVKLIKTENGLQVAQIDGDVIGEGHEGRFNTDNNLIPILTIGGDYVDYKCQEDSYDKCTNKEEVDDSDALTWDKKRYFVPDFSKISIAEQTFNNLFDRSCSVSVDSKVLATDESQKWKGYLLDLKNGVINFEIKSTYTVPSINCIPRYSSDWDVDKLSFTTTQYFSIVARDKIVSPNYKAIPYQEGDTDLYGYFTHSKTYRSNENLSNADGTKRTYLRRFNPDKDSLTYYLSNSFWDEKNAIFLAAAKEAETIINVQNRMYETGLPEIKFEQAHDKRYGDLRYNYLRLFDQPLDNGLLGVANLSSDPSTGEIVSGGFNQFSGNFLSNAYHQYNVIVNDYNFGRMNADKVKEILGIDQYPLNGKAQELPEVTSFTTNSIPAAIPKDDSESSSKTVAQTASYLKYLDEAKTRPTQEKLVENAQSKTQLETWDDGFPLLQEILRNKQKPVTQASLTALSDSVAQPLVNPTPDERAKRNHDSIKLYREKLRYLSENNMLVADAASLGGGMRSLPRGVKGFTIDWKNPELWVNGVVGSRLKKINQLSKPLRSSMVLKTAGVGFVGTIIHEFGHSIGLRHNFKGSLDQEHFFSQEDIAKQKAKLSDAGYPNASLSTDSTSTMEYGVDMMGMGFGPYDLAAIRFGYKREVQDNRATLSDWNNPKYWHSLKAFDEARRAEWAKDEDNGATRLGSVKLLDEKIGSEVADLNPQDSSNGWSNFIGMKYCTDGNVSLNSDCNRFDVGFDIDQISQYYIERYLNRYESRNLRNERRDFYTVDYHSYIPARINEFDRMHEVIEDTAGFENRLSLNENSFDKWCSDTPTRWYCTRVNAKDRVTKFFLQVLTQPNARVLVNFKDNESGKLLLTTPWDYSLDSIERIYDNGVDDGSFDKTRLTKDEQLKMGQVITQYADAPKWFDEIAYQLLLSDRYEEQLRASATPVIKVVGRRLNSAKAKISDPQHPYSNERDVLGIWPDRLIAMQQLVTRHTSRYSDTLTYAALVDYGPINRIFKGVLCRMATGGVDSAISDLVNTESVCNQLAIQQLAKSDVPIPSGYDYKTMQMSDGSPWNGINSIDDISPYYEDTSKQYIEGLSPALTRSVEPFGFDENAGVTKGETNLFGALMNQIALYSTDSDSRGQEKARLIREFVGVHPSTDNVNGLTTTIKGRDYIITDENILAFSLASEITKINTRLADKTDTSSEKYKALLRDRLQHTKFVLGQLPVL